MIMRIEAISFTVLFGAHVRLTDTEVVALAVIVSVVLLPLAITISLVSLRIT